MKRFNYKIKISIICVLFLFSVFPKANAALVICGTNSGDASQACTPDQLVNGVVSIINFLIGSATILTIGYILYGGVNMILARGNPTKFGSAKDTMTHAIEGLIIVLLAYVIVSFAIAFLTGGKTFDQIFNFIPHQ